jgi:hypothetical protein
MSGKWSVLSSEWSNAALIQEYKNSPAVITGQKKYMANI